MPRHITTFHFQAISLKTLRVDVCHIVLKELMLFCKFFEFLVRIRYYQLKGVDWFAIVNGMKHFFSPPFMGVLHGHITAIKIDLLLPELFDKFFQYGNADMIEGVDQDSPLTMVTVVILLFHAL